MVFAPYPILRNDFSCRSESTDKPILAVTDLLNLMCGCQNWSRRFLLDSRFGPDLVQIWSRSGPGRHWIGGEKAGKVVSVQRNIFWHENIGDYFQWCGAHFYTEINF